MLLIAGNQVVRARSIGAFDKHIVVRVAADFKAAGGRHNMAMIFDELKQLLGIPLRIANSGRESTSAYSFKMGCDT
jgi:hypothetical protein